MIYFDNAATTPPVPGAFGAATQCAIFGNPTQRAIFGTPTQLAIFGNPSSSHAVGREAKAELESCRAIIADKLNCKPDEVYFTSGATEACNWAVKSICSTADQRRRSLVASPFEHHAVTEAVEQYNVPKYTKLDLAQMLVNNETGQLYDVKSLCKKGGLVFCDATAAVGHIPVDFKALGADYMAFGGHKFGSLKGIGALIVKEGCPIAPMIFGGAQERGMRGGTVSVPLVSSMAAALTWRSLHMAENEKAIRAVAQELIISLGCHRVDFDINLPGGKSSKDCAPHILSIRFPGVYGAALAAALSERGVMVSTGSACSSGDNAASANLIASGLTEQQALETIRFSFDWYNTRQEAAHAARIIADIVPALRRG